MDMKSDLTVRRFLPALMCILFLSPMPALAQGQSWPSRPIRLIVPQGPGSGTDTIARLIADGLTPRLGQTIVVENLPAASGLLAHQVAARAAPDGTTFLFSTVSGLAINPVTVKALPYDAAKDFTPVAMVVDFAPQMLSVNAEMPIQSVSEFVSYAKANPGKLSYGLDITVTAAVVSARLLAKRAGLDMVEVPYRSPAQMATDVASGRVPATVSSLAASGAMIQAGKIRPLGWFSSKRFSYQPGTPTVAETVPGVAIDAWFIIVAPTGTPTEAINRLNQEINEVLKAGDIGVRFAKVGLGVSGTGTPDSLAEFIRGEQEKWRLLALELNLEAQ
jgi:tripartite-type tricarboxylate transporter receptor subunit TctC